MTRMSKRHLYLKFVREHIKVASQVLDTLVKIKEANSTAGRVLGAVTLVGHAIDFGQTSINSAHQWFKLHGYKVVVDGTMAVVVRDFLRREVDPDIVAFDQGSAVVEDFKNGFATSVYADYPEWSDSIRVRQDVKNPADIMRSLFWKQQSVAEIVVKETKHGAALTVQPMVLSGDFVASSVSVAEVAALLEGGGSLLLVGTTGTGKTTFCRLLGEALSKDGVSKVLRVSGSAILHLSPKDLIDFVHWVRPDVLILEDLQGLFTDTGRSSLEAKEASFLSLLEALQQRGGVVVGTMMIPASKVADIQELKPGSLHFHGLRPGRFDHVRFFAPFTPEQREAVLRHYLRVPISDEVMRELVEGSVTLSGAYLKSLADAVNRGDPDISLTLKRLLAFAPVSEETTPTLTSLSTLPKSTSDG